MPHSRPPTEHPPQDGADLTLGIDFGTSNSAAALVGPRRADAHHDARWQPRRDAHRLSSPAKPTVLYGSQAMQAYLTGHRGTPAASLKSLLGSRLMDRYTIRQRAKRALLRHRGAVLQGLKRCCEKRRWARASRAPCWAAGAFVDDDDDARDALAQTLGRAARPASPTSPSSSNPLPPHWTLNSACPARDHHPGGGHGGGTSDFTVIRLNPSAARRRTAAPTFSPPPACIGGTDFDRLLDLATVMPLMGCKHIGTGGRPVPSSVFLDLSTWHLIQAYTRKALHFAKELWSDYADRRLHARLMDALHGQHGHRMLAQVKATRSPAPSLGENAVNLDFSGNGASKHNRASRRHRIGQHPGHQPCKTP